MPVKFSLAFLVVGNKRLCLSCLLRCNMHPICIILSEGSAWCISEVSCGISPFSFLFFLLPDTEDTSPTHWLDCWHVGVWMMVIFFISTFWHISSNNSDGFSTGMGLLSSKWQTQKRSLVTRLFVFVKRWTCFFLDLLKIAFFFFFLHDFYFLLWKASSPSLNGMVNWAKK